MVVLDSCVKGYIFSTTMEKEATKKIIPGGELFVRDYNEIIRSSFFLR
jgi:hypothetical protein